VFGSKPVVFISDVGSGIDSGCSGRVSALGSVLPDLLLLPKPKPYPLARACSTEREGDAEGMHNNTETMAGYDNSKVHREKERAARGREKSRDIATIRKEQ